MNHRISASIAWSDSASRLLETFAGLAKEAVNANPRARRQWLRNSSAPDAPHLRGDPARHNCIAVPEKGEYVCRVLVPSSEADVGAEQDRVGRGRPLRRAGRPPEVLGLRP
jgi:hypothetical protein